ncbi:MAG: hypothetical protein F2694_06645 [Actinobacteria bacterium]|uniref:Unannotated protein n=1 Tax=freshwater metagenome TaxID=449393 RepID=A0A6J6TD56_9ZZZZ|nr:hypothetical protein [Actinomycetota bacterium]
MRRVSGVRGVGVFAVLASVSAVLGSVVATPVVGASVVTAPVSASVVAPVVGGLGYVPLAEPCRVVDTRVAGGVLAAGGSRGFQVAGSGANFVAQGGTSGGCGIPDGVGAAEISVTVVAPVGNGYLRVGPNDGSDPAATFLAYNSGVGITNTGTVPLDATNPLDLFVKNFVGDTQVVIDVQGYYTAGTGVGYVPLAAPCRVVDTRVVGGALAAGGSRAFQVAGSGVNFVAQGGTDDGCGIPAGVTAAEVTVTAISPSGSGYLRVAPNDGSNPTATFLAYSSGIGIANTGTVTMSAAGDSKDLLVRNFVGATQLVIDVQGYFPASGGTRYQTVTPCRVVDTRNTGGVLASGVARGFQVGGTRVGFRAQGATNPVGCGVPQRTAAVEASLTAVAPVANGYARVFPAGATPPNATFLAYSTGRNITNTGTIGLSLSGLNDLNLKNFASSTQYVLDVLGYFEPPVAFPLSAEQTSAGGEHNCQLRSIGTAQCWGDNTYGQLGDGTLINKSTPVDVTGLTDAVQIAAGASHSCALLADGTTKCWGHNLFGELGNGTTTASLLPVAVTGLVGAVQIAAGRYHSCALLADGTAKCWAHNVFGELGSGTTTDSLVPVVVTALVGAVQITAGDYHSCSLLADGTEKCWGHNFRGQLGKYTPFDSLVPLVVTGVAGAIQIAAGTALSCALLADGTAKCWGYNFYGQLGDGTTTNDFVPVVVSGLAGAVQITAGDYHSCALLAGGSEKCWGYNYSGQLGEGTITNSSVPVAVLNRP